jgi:hypothetical protein
VIALAVGPLVASIVVAVSCPRLVRRTAPRAAAWALSTAGALLAISSAGSLALLAFPLVARLPLLARLGG